MTVRYTLVQLPDGSKHPICLEKELEYHQDVPPDGIMYRLGDQVRAMTTKNWEEAW
jgi:hypothetical protein